MTSAAVLLRDTFRKYADNVFLVDSQAGKEYTYRQVEELSLKIASYLKQQGYEKGDRLGFLLPNSMEIALFYFGALQAGIVAAPINPALHPREISVILERARLKGLLMPQKNRGHLEKKNVSLDSLRIMDPFTVNLENLPGGDALSFDGIRDDDLAAIMFSSGTTGLPKGVRIEYQKVVGNGLAYIGRLGFTPDLRFPSILSMTYLGGWYNLLLIPFLAGASLIVTETFNAASSLSFWKLCADRKATAIWFVPTIMSLLLSLARDERAIGFVRNQIKLALVGTAPLSAELKQRFEEKFGVTVHENYALAETLFITSNSPNKKFKLGSVGTLLDGVGVEIADSDGKPLPRGEVGEIVVTTPYGIQRYENDPEQTAQLIRDGRYFTGDLGELDEENFLYIRGRKKDLIIRGGINIAPREIEEVLSRHPAVQEVSVVGMPHEVFGEEVVATIKLKQFCQDTTVDDIVRFCQDHLSEFKCPRKVFFIDEFPKNYAGKIQKEKLKVLIKSKMVSLLG